MAPRWLDTILEELYKSTNPADSKRRLENVLKAFEEAAIENYRDNSEVDRPLVMISMESMAMVGNESSQEAIRDHAKEQCYPLQSIDKETRTIQGAGRRNEPSSRSLDASRRENQISRAQQLLPDGSFGKSDWA